MILSLYVSIVFYESVAIIITTTTILFLLFTITQLNQIIYIYILDSTTIYISTHLYLSWQLKTVLCIHMTGKNIKHVIFTMFCSQTVKYSTARHEREGILSFCTLKYSQFSKSSFVWFTYTSSHVLCFWHISFSHFLSLCVS